VSVEEQSSEWLIKSYVDAAQRQALASDGSNVAAANDAADELAAIHSELRSRSDNSGVKLLLPLLSHSTANVRLWAASHTLDVVPKDAEAELEMLAEVGGFIGITAATTLAEWRAGRLKFR
jgi:hypothetical protein